MSSISLTRREFVKGAVTVAASATTLRTSPHAYAEDEESRSRQATGTRVGEITDVSAIVWTRLTAHSSRNNQGIVITKRDEKLGAGSTWLTVPVEDLDGACPGASGRVRLRYGDRDDLSGATVTDWFDVDDSRDFIHQFHLTGLTPGTLYHYASETAGPGVSPPQDSFRGKFKTAPRPNTSQRIQFCVMTCQGYPDRGHPDGHPIYPAMRALDPDFAVLTGDLVYYDNDPPRAVTARLARYHWERMFSLSRLVEFNRNFGTYWLKDDHDTLNNDSWPDKAMGEFTFAEGQRIFREQAPLADGPCYRTFRWGRDLQIWLTDGRDYRSPNNEPDGPEKTIWGSKQKAWFKQTVEESDATWKVLISPTPLVGPDRKNKKDNHANLGFRHEGDEIRNWLKRHVPQNFFVICGDRHWQYHSIHPQTGLHEFSVGAASDQHAGGSPGEDKTYHRFHRVKGGFLSVDARTQAIDFRHHDVDGNVVYQHTAPLRSS